RRIRDRLEERRHFVFRWHEVPQHVELAAVGLGFLFHLGRGALGHFTLGDPVERIERVEARRELRELLVLGRPYHLLVDDRESDRHHRDQQQLFVALVLWQESHGLPRRKAERDTTNHRRVR